MENLFSNNEPEEIVLDRGEILLLENFLSNEEGDRLLKEFLSYDEWGQNTIKIFRKEFLEPRKSIFYGTKDYTYSGLKMPKREMPSTLLDLKSRVEEYTFNSRFNSALLNLYRHGDDSMGWHSDDEKELGLNPVIASISVGASRKFKIREKVKGGITRTILLHHGTLLIMKGEMQHFWKHAIPKESHVKEPRINITFREIKY